MLAKEINDRLTRVDGDAPMGRMMRQCFWVPFARPQQIEPDGAPLPVRLLGRNYVAFRATDGRIGFFDEACPHRGCSLVLARNEACALQCIFHGWRIDVSGKVVDIPSEGDRSQQLAARIKVNHYPVIQGGGLLWVFLGTGKPPAKPRLPFFDLPAENVWMTRTVSRVNWLQGVEGTLDSVHIGNLHKSYIKASTTGMISLAHDANPYYECEDTDYGIRAAALRPLADGNVYARVTEYVMPFVSMTPNQGNRVGNMFISVPIDDTNHILFFGLWDEDKPAGPRVGGPIGTGIGYDPDNYAPIMGDRDTAWGQDRKAMAEGHFSGFTNSLLREDIVVQASMGPIVDRSIEQLCASDIAVTQGRARLLAALRDFEAGRPPLHRGPEEKAPQPVDSILRSKEDWRTATHTM